MSLYALQLPNNYVEIERDEMEYVDGGSALTDKMFSVRSVGAAINTIIGFAIPMGGISSFVAKKGTANAARYLEAAVVNKLKTMGILVGGGTVIGGLTYALNYIDVGTNFAKFLDSIDASPNNGIVWGF